jgi:hypothetical protein
MSRAKKQLRRGIHLTEKGYSAIGKTAPTTKPSESIKVFVPSDVTPVERDRIHRAIAFVLETPPRDPEPPRAA